MEEEHSSASRPLDDGRKEEPELQRRHGRVCAGGRQGISCMVWRGAHRNTKSRSSFTRRASTMQPTAT